MTQRIFDIKNEKDMADLWDILLNSINKIKKANNPDNFDTLYFQNGAQLSSIIQINWHDKTEITRPIQEATEADIGKLCVLWNDIKHIHYGVLAYMGYSKEMPYYATNVDGGTTFNHCRRLTKQEIEELC